MMPRDFADFLVGIGVFRNVMGCIGFSAVVLREHLPNINSNDLSSLILMRRSS